MEEITYNDVLVHYQRMMADITDELQQLENSLEKISVFSQQTWKGKAGDACFEKLQELYGEIKKQLMKAQELSEAFRQARVNYDILFPEVIQQTDISEE